MASKKKDCGCGTKGGVKPTLKYCGDRLECINVEKGDDFNTVLGKINTAVCTECDCSPLVATRMWAGDFSAFTTNTWMRTNTAYPDNTYSSALLQTISTGAGTYEIDLETAISVDSGFAVNWVLGLRVNGATPSTPAYTPGTSLSNFASSELRTSSGNYPTTSKLYVNLAQGDTLIPDLKVTYISGGTPQLDYIKMIIKKM